jgi:class 3 adenylate cyclase
MRDLPTGTITLLFTDIEESTYLLQRLGERYAELLNEYRTLLRTAFHTYHGQEVDTQGDAMFAAFARASDALEASVAAQRELALHSWPCAVAVRVRMGLHTGEPSRAVEGYVGLDVHYAARVMSAAYGGQVLLSQTTRDLVEHDLPDGVSLRDLGEHHLKDLEQAVHLYQVIIAGLPADFPPLRTHDRRSDTLPVQPTPLIGREREVVTVVRLLHREKVRLVTFTGPGGTGKTRLALQVAAKLRGVYVGGVFFVSLASLNDPTLVIPTIARTLGIRESVGQPVFARLVEVLQQKQVLLLLDNFEQVVEAAHHVADLLTSCPQLKLLVTSREVLHVRFEHEFAVPPLALPDPAHLPKHAALARIPAVALFLQRVQTARPEFKLTSTNARAVAEICVRLDGLPLAIELAAARMKLLSPQTLLARLDHPLIMLTGGARDVPARQQTLRNTIEWSYQLLNAGEQRLFRWLSVFVSGCSLQAAEAVCTGPGDGAGQVLDGGRK